MQVFGSEKTLYVGGERLLILPAGANSPIEDLGYLNLGSRADSAQTQPDSATPGPDTLTVSHMKEFADCVRLRRDPSATVEAAEAALFPCVAANIAYRVGRKLYVNPDNQKFFSDPELKTPDADADRLMIRIYRKPYEPPKV